MNRILIYCDVAISRIVLRRALIVAIIVGAILNLINQGTAIFTLDLAQINISKLILTFFVPYAVSTYSSTKARLTFKVNEVSAMDAVLHCKSCDNGIISINKGEIVPPCQNCNDKKTKWTIVKKGKNEHRHIEDEFRSMALFAQMNPAPVMRFDNTGLIKKSNLGANNAFEVSDVEGKIVTDLVPEIKSIDFDLFIQNGEIKSVTTKNKHGRSFRFELRGLPQYGSVQMYGADISEMVSARLEAAKFYTAIEQTSNSIMVTNTKGEIEFVNSSFETISGYTLEEVRGLNPRFLKTGKTSDEEYKKLWRTIANGEVWHGELLNKRKNGSTYWELSTITPVRDENNKIVSYIAIKEDVTEKRRIEQDLKSMALFARLNPEPVFRFDYQGNILKANPAANEAFNLKTIEQRNIHDLLSELKDVDCRQFIDMERIEVIEATVDSRIYRFIMRGIKELDVVQTYGSDITKRKQAEEKVKKQKQAIESSIQYASRIQNAVLPAEKKLMSRFQDAFILYKPRDVVSGDFYWSKQYEDKTIVVAADCTGHGVPGAIMSMLGVSLLNEIVNAEPGAQAGRILDRMRENLKSTLSQNADEHKAKDGMDLALCIIEHSTLKLQYAGAYNPLIICRGNELMEYKADRMPIGSHIREKPHFTSQNIQLKPNDAFYMFSDGYPDQFGGEKMHKFTAKALRQILIDNHSKSMAEQKVIFDTRFNEWKGEGEQIDDVLVMGFRV